MLTMNRSSQESLTELLSVVDRAAREASVSYHMAYGTLLGAVRHKGFIPWDTDVDLYVANQDMDQLCRAIRAVDPERYRVMTRKYDSSYNKLLPRLTFVGSDHHLLHVDLFPLMGLPRGKLASRILGQISYISYRAFNLKRIDAQSRYDGLTRKRRLVKAAQIALLPVPAALFEVIFNRASSHFELGNSDRVRNACGSYGHREEFPRQWMMETTDLPFETLEIPAFSRWDAYLRQMYGDYLVPREKNYLS